LLSLTVRADAGMGSLGWFRPREISQKNYKSTTCQAMIAEHRRCIGIGVLRQYAA
jgi:hypothetical protein